MRKIALLFLTLSCLPAAGQSAANNGLQQELVENWVDGAWQNLLSRTITQDANGYKQQQIESTWDVPTSQWKLYEKTDYTVTADGNIDIQTAQHWSSDNLAYSNFLLTNHTYNTAGQLVTAVSKGWTNGEWSNAYRRNFYYEGGQLVEYLYELWNGSASYPDKKIVYTSDNTERIIQEIHYLYDANT
jgi:hypothetical protein